MEGRRSGTGLSLGGRGTRRKLGSEKGKEEGQPPPLSLQKSRFCNRNRFLGCLWPTNPWISDTHPLSKAIPWFGQSWV